jgi:PKD repeat protein
MTQQGTNTIMRTTKLSIITIVAAATVAACTVREIDAPALSGPSSLARTIVMIADRDTLLQDGVQEAAIRLTAQVQPGQSENVRLRAQVFVDGVAQDFGTLSNKNPTTPTTIFFRAPPASTAVNGQVPTTVTIAVTPDDQGDFRSEFTRQLDLRLIPPGVILPTNPSLIADFEFEPADPRVFDSVTFDASPTMNGGVACRNNCSYRWNFGDGTTAEGLIATHQFRTVGTFSVSLTATDLRGAQDTAIEPVPVNPGIPPTAAFTFSPTSPEPGQTVFFNASETRAAPGRAIVDYFWDFGDGTTASGSAVSHTYPIAGDFVVTLKVTDDAGSFQTSTQNVTVETP